MDRHAVHHARLGGDCGVEALHLAAQTPAEAALWCRALRARAASHHCCIAVTAAAAAAAAARPSQTARCEGADAQLEQPRDWEQPAEAAAHAHAARPSEAALMGELRVSAGEFAADSDGHLVQRPLLHEARGKGVWRKAFYLLLPGAPTLAAYASGSAGSAAAGATQLRPAGRLLQRDVELAGADVLVPAVEAGGGTENGVFALRRGGGAVMTYFQTYPASVERKAVWVAAISAVLRRLRLPQPPPPRAASAAAGRALGNLPERGHTARGHTSGAAMPVPVPAPVLRCRGTQLYGENGPLLFLPASASSSAPVSASASASSVGWATGFFLLVFAFDRGSMLLSRGSSTAHNTAHNTAAAAGGGCHGGGGGGCDYGGGGGCGAAVIEQYASSAEAHPKARFLIGVDATVAVGAAGGSGGSSGGGGVFPFTLTVPCGVLRLAATSASVRSRWVRALRRAVYTAADSLAGRAAAAAGGLAVLPLPLHVPSGAAAGMYGVGGAGAGGSGGGTGGGGPSWEALWHQQPPTAAGGLLPGAAAKGKGKGKRRVGGAAAAGSAGAAAAASRQWWGGEGREARGDGGDGRRVLQDALAAEAAAVLRKRDACSADGLAFSSLIAGAAAGVTGGGGGSGGSGGAGSSAEQTSSLALVPLRLELAAELKKERECELQRERERERERELELEHTGRFDHAAARGFDSAWNAQRWGMSFDLERLESPPAPSPPTRSARSPEAVGVSTLRAVQWLLQQHGLRLQRRRQWLVVSRLEGTAAPSADGAGASISTDRESAVQMANPLVQASLRQAEARRAQLLGGGAVVVAVGGVDCSLLPLQRSAELLHRHYHAAFEAAGRSGPGSGSAPGKGSAKAKPALELTLLRAPARCGVLYKQPSSVSASLLSRSLQSRLNKSLKAWKPRYFVLQVRA
jgi:hypothetical protein